jgi:hypothetical protein
LRSEKLEASPAGADTVPELESNERKDVYVPQADVIPSCLVLDLLRLPQNPVAAWRLLRLRASKLGLLEQCSSLWRLLRALASSSHREESCVNLELVDGNAHFVGSRWATLEAILPALAPLVPLAAPPLVAVANETQTASLAAITEAATRSSTPKVVVVEEKWPHSYGCLLLLTGAVDVDSLPGFWHEYANQKKAHDGPTCSQLQPPWQVASVSRPPPSWPGWLKCWIRSS